MRYPVRNRLAVCDLAAGLLGAGPVLAAPPAPANDAPANATPITTLPAVLYGTTVGANDSISVAQAPVADVDGLDVFYTFTPGTTGTYRFQLVPWQRTALRSSNRQMSLYVQTTEAFVGGIRAASSNRPVHLDVTLQAGTSYLIGVDNSSSGALDNNDFTLLVDALSAANPDACGAPEAIPSASLPVAVVRNIDGALNDHSFSQGFGRCAVGGATPNTGPGNDHVYTFTPTISGDYAFDLVNSINSGTAGFKPMIYIATDCNPIPTGCVAASDGGSAHELIVATLSAGVTYYVYVDNTSTTAGDQVGAYALIVDTAAAYHITETEPNDSTAAATPVTTPIAGGQLQGQSDTDYWAITGAVGDRVYAFANAPATGTTPSTIDANMYFRDMFGGIIEFDEEDGDGWESPSDNDYHFTWSTDSPVIAGARFTSAGTHYLEVTDLTPSEASDTTIMLRYRLFFGTQPGTRQPTPEVEPNDTRAFADTSGTQFYSGAITRADDLDVFSFQATAGEWVFIAIDGDPERNATGNTAPSSDPKAFMADLNVYDADGDVLVSGGDSNSIQDAPDYAAQGVAFLAKKTGTYYAEIERGDTSQFGAEKTYNLAIFKNNAAFPVTEDVNPTLALTPDFGADVVNAAASDAGSGLASIELVGATNLQLVNATVTPGQSSANFSVQLVNGAVNGYGKVRVTDVAGNTAAGEVRIDVVGPSAGATIATAREYDSVGGPFYIPDNDATGISIPIAVPESGLVTDVNVRVWAEHNEPGNLDIFLQSPAGTLVELVTQRISSSAYDVNGLTFDDSAEEAISFPTDTSGTFRPETGMLSVLNGQNAQGEWRLVVSDRSGTASNGGHLLRWQLQLESTAPNGPQFVKGAATDTATFDSGIQSIALNSATNAVLNLPAFTPGDASVDYTVTLSNPAAPGSGTIVVTDIQGNSVSAPVTLLPRSDNLAPTNSGEATTQIRASAEPELTVPNSSASTQAPSVSSTITIPQSFEVTDVNAQVIIDSEAIGLLAIWLKHDGEFAVLANRVGITDRSPTATGLGKDNVYVTFDDEAEDPLKDDPHTQTAASTTPFLGVWRPDARIGIDTEYGDFGQGISSDPRTNFLSEFDGQESDGAWELRVGSFRRFGTNPGSDRHVIQRWSLTISTNGPQRYYGQAFDLEPGAGLCSIALAPGATNLTLSTDLVSGADRASYLVELTNPAQNGSGTVVITDCAGNATNVPITLTGTAPACRADFDNMNGVQVADIFAFLRAWFANDPSADFDGMNGIQVADIFAFLRAWFAGCP